MTPVCRGSYVLGTACGGCSRCAAEWKQRRADGWRFISPSIEIMDATTAAKRDAALERGRTIEANADLVLWCVHVLGPDDMYAAPSHAAAVAKAHELNVSLANRATPVLNDILCFAYAAPWPYSKQAHERGVKNWAEETF